MDSSVPRVSYYQLLLSSTQKIVETQSLLQPEEVTVVREENSKISLVYLEEIIKKPSRSNHTQGLLSSLLYYTHLTLRHTLVRSAYLHPLEGNVDYHRKTFSGSAKGFSSRRNGAVRLIAWQTDRTKAVFELAEYCPVENERHSSRAICMSLERATCLEARLARSRVVAR